jgi:hypothetical protein
MPRTCTICTHPERPAIEQALVTNESYRNIAEHFVVSVGALTRHKAEHLPAALVQATKAQQDEDAIDVMIELRRLFRRVNLLLDACDAWLRDPDDPTRYTLEPRADELSVIYLEPDAEGKPVRKKAPLSVLLGQMKGKSVIRWEAKHADPRELILKTAAQLQGQQEFLAKLIGQLQQEGTVNILIAPQWVEVRTALLRALGDFPDARAAAALVLQQVGHADV